MTQETVKLTIRTHTERVGSLRFDNLQEGLGIIAALGSYSLWLQDRNPEVAKAAIRVQGLIADSLGQPNIEWPHRFTLERELCTPVGGGLTEAGEDTDLESLAVYGAMQMFSGEYSVVREAGGGRAN